jgi:hypothetical protein
MVTQNSITKHLLLILFAAYAMGITSCSYVSRSPVMKPEMVDVGWVRSERDKGDPDPPLKLEYENGNVSVCPSPTESFNCPKVLFFGPPILPFIPVFSSQDCGRLSVQVEIEDQKGTSIVDISKVRIEIGNKSLPPIGVFPGPIGKVIISFEKKHFDIIFDLPYKELKEFSLSLGEISVNGKTIPLPPIKYRKHQQYHYAPFFYKMGSREYRF